MFHVKEGVSRYDSVNQSAKQQMSQESETVRPGGRKKSPVIVKVSIDERTSLELLTVKPNTITLSGFCAMMIELGLREWQKREALYANSIQP